jgi:NhaP-type Na+/H+ or K+/H+ antiporter
MILHSIALLIHLGSLAIAGCGVLVADKVGFAWMSGKTKKLAPRTLHILHEVVSYALVGLIASGLYLFWPMREYLLHQNLFLLKLGFVAALVINSIVIDRLMIVAAKVPFASVSTKGKIVLFLSGALSFICWVGAGLSALLLFVFGF